MFFHSLTLMVKKMYNIEPKKYFSGFYNFLKNSDNSKVSIRKIALYIVLVILILILGQIIARNSEPYKSDNIENQKFIKTEISKQIIIDTFSQPLTQTCFKSYFSIRLSDGSAYRINIADEQINGKINIKSIISKRANAKKFEIINDNKKYNFSVTELDNFDTELFLFISSLLISIVFIPLWFKHNELGKEYEKIRC